MAAGITVATPNPAAREPGDRAGYAGKRQRRTHPDRRDEPADSGHRALTEPVDEAVPDQPADELEADQRDVAEHRQRAGRAEAVAQIHSGPRTSGILDHRPRDGDEDQRA